MGQALHAWKVLLNLLGDILNRSIRCIDDPAKVTKMGLHCLDTLHDSCPLSRGFRSCRIPDLERP